MNKLATALLFSVIATVLIGCSSGSSSAPEPQNVAGTYQGTFENTDGTQRGVATFTLVQSQNSFVVTGNAIFDRNGGNTCLISGQVTEGLVNGFDVALTVAPINFQLAVSNNGQTLSGTYTNGAPSDDCGASTGSGNITINRQ